MPADPRLRTEMGGEQQLSPALESAVKVQRPPRTGKGRLPGKGVSGGLFPASPPLRHVASSSGSLEPVCLGWAPQVARLSSRYLDTEVEPPAMESTLLTFSIPMRPRLSRHCFLWRSGKTPTKRDRNRLTGKEV